MPYIHFTDEQKQQANLVDLSEFLRCRGEPLIVSGRELRMGSNHSVTVRGNEWYDHAAETGGGPVSFLKDHAGKDGSCWPGINTIAAGVSLSRSTVKRALDDLVRAGLVVKEERWRGNGSLTSNLYQVMHD